MCGRVYWIPFCVLLIKLGSDFLQDNCESASDPSAKMHITCNSRGYQLFLYFKNVHKEFLCQKIRKPPNKIYKNMPFNKPSF